MIINSKYQFIFVHIPKTGGTSVQSVLRDLEGNEVLLCNFRTKHETFCQLRRRIRYRLLYRNAFQVLNGRPPFKSSDILNFNVMAVSRHPVDRFRSLFNYLKTIGHHAVSQYSNLEEFAFASLDFAKDSNLHSLRPQVRFIEGVDVQKLDIHKFEEMDSKLEIPFGVGSMSLHMPRLNRSRVHEGSSIDKRVRCLIEDYYHEDMLYFGY